MDGLEARREKDRIRMQGRRKIAKEKNLCIRCCLRPAQKGKTACKKCEKYLENWQFGRFYGLTTREVKAQRRIQKNRCAICKDKFNKLVHVDHDHKTGKFRALLCPRCNQGLGLFRENLQIFQKAIKYLAYHKRRKDDLRTRGKF